MYFNAFVFFPYFASKEDRKTNTKRTQKRNKKNDHGNVLDHSCFFDPELLKKSSIFQASLPIELNSAIELSEKNNPDLKISEFEYQQSKKDTSNAKSDLAPTATLSFDKSKTEDLSATYDEREKDVLKATVTWPFFSGGKNYANFKKNKSSCRKQRTPF